jgi:hypothetical protein
MSRERELLHGKVTHNGDWSLWQYDVYHYGWQVGTTFILVTMVAGSPVTHEINPDIPVYWIPTSVINWANSIIGQVDQ